MLGIPAEKAGQLLTPLSVPTLKTEELLTALWPGQTLCGGMLSQDTALAAVRAGLSACDLMGRRDFTLGNAVCPCNSLQKAMLFELFINVQYLTYRGIKSSK